MIDINELDSVKYGPGVSILTEDENGTNIHICSFNDYHITQIFTDNFDFEEFTEEKWVKKRNGEWTLKLSYFVKEQKCNKA